MNPSPLSAHPTLEKETVYTSPDPLGTPTESREIAANGNRIIEFPDGSAFIGPEEDKQSLYPDMAKKSRHNENLALYLNESELREIGYSIKHAVEADIASQEEFFEAISEILEYFGTMLNSASEDLDFNGASDVYDPALLQTLLEVVIHACELIFRDTDTKILGNQTERSIDIASRKKDFINYFLNDVSKGSMKENYRTLMWAVLAGSAYKKVYVCPIKNHPDSLFIPIRDFIVNSSHSSHYSASRKTHILRMDEREFMLNVNAGMYKDISVVYQDDYMDSEHPIESQLNNIDGYTPELSSQTQSGVVLYEAHVDYRIKSDPEAKGTDVPLPYRITVDQKTGNITAIYRNWVEGDSLKKRIEFFVNYSFLPAFKGEGYGMVHYAGKSSRAATVILRQMIDATTKSNFPGGIYQAGIRLENNNIRPAPGEWVPVNTGGNNIQNALLPFPYKEASPALFALRNEIADSIRKPSAIVNEKIVDMAAKSATETVLAIIESMQRVPNAINYGFYRSRTEELKLINDRFYECLSDTQDYPFLVDGGENVVIRDDFAPNSNVILIPASNPNTDNSIHRMVQAEIMIRNAKENPTFFNLKYAYEYLFKTLKFPEDVIKKLLTPEDNNKQEPPPPVDPVSTMMALIKGEPVEAAVWQDHDAYIAIIDSWMQTNQQDPNIPAAAALKKKHEAFKYMVDAYAKLNMAPPEEPSQLSPEQQNQLAVAIARIKVQEAQEAAASAQGPEPLMDPAKAELEAAKMQADVAHERNEVELKKLDVSLQKIHMDYELKVQEFQAKDQIEHLKQQIEQSKADVDFFKVAHEQAIKERDQVLKEMESRQENSVIE